MGADFREVKSAAHQELFSTRILLPQLRLRLKFPTTSSTLRLLRKFAKTVIPWPTAPPASRRAAPTGCQPCPLCPRSHQSQPTRAVSPSPQTTAGNPHSWPPPAPPAGAWPRLDRA